MTCCFFKHVYRDFFPIINCYSKAKRFGFVIKFSMSPSQTSVLSACRGATSAVWTCHGGICRSTVWSAGVALSSASTAAATWPWETSRITAGPACPRTGFHRCLQTRWNQVQTLIWRGSKICHGHLHVPPRLQQDWVWPVTGVKHRFLLRISSHIRYLRTSRLWICILIFSRHSDFSSTATVDFIFSHNSITYNI